MATATESSQGTMAEARLRMQSTLMWGGAGLAVGSALPLLHRLALELSVPNALVEVTYYASLASTPILCVALLILAFGLPGESGIGGRSIVATVSIAALAGLLLIGFADGLLFPTVTESLAMSLNWYFTSLYVLTGVAAIVAALAVQRAGVLTGLALPGGVIVVLLNVAITVLPRFFMDLLEQQNQTAIEVLVLLGTVAVLAQIALGILYFLQGRRLKPVTD